MGEEVSFKGNKDGIVLLLDCSVEFETLCQMIVQKLWQSRSFLGEHTTLIVNSGDVCLNDGQRLALKVLLQSLGHDIKYFIPDKPDPKDSLAASFGLVAAELEQSVLRQREAEKRQRELEAQEAEKMSVSAAQAYVSEGQAQLADTEQYLSAGALAIRKNIRSGQKISCDGTLIVFGDVNAGAELVATGHILVLGALRGVAHAGCQGDKNAVIYAHELSSLQLRIADLIARAPDGENNQRRVPELARIIDNYLVIEEV